MHSCFNGLFRQCSFALNESLWSQPKHTSAKTCQDVTSCLKHRLDPQNPVKKVHFSAWSHSFTPRNVGSITSTDSFHESVSWWGGFLTIYGVPVGFISSLFSGRCPPTPVTCVYSPQSRYEISPTEATSVWERNVDGVGTCCKDSCAAGFQQNQRDDCARLTLREKRGERRSALNANEGLQEKKLQVNIWHGNYGLAVVSVWSGFQWCRVEINKADRKESCSLHSCKQLLVFPSCFMKLHYFYADVHSL